MEAILRYFTKDKLIVNLIVITVTLFGLNSLRNIKQEHMPPVDIDKMTIIVNYPGASSRDVELNVLIPIEDVLREISGIDEYVGVAMENMAQLRINLDEDIRNKQKVKDQIFREVSKNNIPDLPEDVDEIRIIDLNPKEKPVYKVLLSLKKESPHGYRELYDMVDTLESLLRRVPGVSSVSKQAYREREVHIDVIPELLDRYNISLSDISQSIKTRNVRSTGGTMHSTQSERTVVTIGQFENPMDVGDVIIRSGFEQRRIRVKDVAHIRDTFDKESVRAMVNGRPGVLLSVKKKENADVIRTVENIKDFFSDRESLWKKDFDLTLVDDDSQIIRALLKVVKSNAIIGFFLVVLVLFVFLDFKTSIWTAFGIPFSMLVVVSLMYLWDVSFNVLTIGAIITVLGMLVDDAIVVAENIYDKKQLGMPAFEAVIQGSKEVIAPVSITVLSTILAFLPMVMIGGIMGKFIYFFPIVITLALLASLSESIFILPSHLNFENTKQKKQAKSKANGSWFIRYMDLYYKSLISALKHRYLVALGFILIFLFTVFLSEEAIRKFVLFWDNSSEIITLNMSAKPGTSLEKTESLTREVSKAVRKIIAKKDLVSTYILSGKHGGRGFHAETHDHWSSLQIKLVPITEREISAGEYTELLRKNINSKIFPVFEEIVIQAQESGPPTGSPIDIKIISNNDRHLKEATSQIKSYLRTVPGVKDLDDDEKKGTQEIVVDFNYDKLAQYGINVQSVAQTVRTAFEGTVSSYVQTPSHRIEFRVQVDPKYKISERFLKSLLIPNVTGRLIQLGDIANFHYEDGSAAIKHYNGDRAISVTAEVNPDITTSKIVNQQVRKEFAEIGKRFQGLYLVLTGEAKQTEETIGDLYVAFGLAFLLIYFIIVLLFRSIIQPFIVLSVIPFGLTGVLLALSAHGIPLSFMAFIGFIGLSGVVVNDSVIMVDFINSIVRKQNKEIADLNSLDKEKFFQQIAQGARQRLRPIILTTVTTVAGLLPTVYGIGGEAKMMVPTVMAIAYGELFATLLTLYLVPSLYMMQIDLSLFISTLGKKIRVLIWR